MKIRQNLLTIAIILAVFSVGVGKAQAASLSLSPSSGVAGSQFTISGSGLTSNLPVTAEWDSGGLDVSNAQADENGGYISSAQVPSGETAGQHTVKITSASVMLNYYPKTRRLSQIFVTRARAVDSVFASATFTVTVPAVASSSASVADSSSTASISSPASSATSTSSSARAKTSSRSSSVSSQTSTGSSSSADLQQSSSQSSASEQNDPAKEVNKGVRMCYLPWWVWVLLILVTLINLALFLSRFWKRKSRQPEDKLK